jgi:hypothetical protein
MNQPLHAHTAQPFARFDIYHRIHKALRLCMTDTMLWVGRLDCADPRDVAAAMAQVRSIAAFCASHLDHEDQFVHPALEARSPGAAQQTELEHVHHFAACARLAELADAVEAARAPASQALANRLYRELALFFVDSVNHMDIEESNNNAALWATHSDAELLAIEHAIIGSLSDQERGVTMRWMIPALTPSELLAMVEGVRQQAPAQVFTATLVGMQALLSQQDWLKLCDGLGCAEQLAA